MNASDYRAVGRNPDGSIKLRVRFLAAIARLVGVQFQIGGWPYGASWRRCISYRESEPGCSSAAAG
jgi:hypothetical protein